MPAITIRSNGLNQYDLVDLIVSIKTKFNALLAKLDADATVNDTTYASLWALTIPAGIQTTGAKAILCQKDISDFMQDFVTKFAGVTAKLDADSGVSGTNFGSLWNPVDYIGAERDAIRGRALHQGPLVNQLDYYIARLAGLNAKLDLDGGVADTNYAATCNVTDSVDSSMTSARI